MVLVRSVTAFCAVSAASWAASAAVCACCAAASAAAAVSYIVLYLTKSFFYNGLLIKGLTPGAAWLGVLERIPSSAFNGIVAVIFAPILGVALHKALKAAHLERLTPAGNS